MARIPSGAELERKMEEIGLPLPSGESVAAKQSRYLEASRQIRDSRVWWFALLSAIVSVISVAAAWFSSCQSQRRFAYSQRASVILGSPDGNLGEFAFSGPDARLMLHFKNYGQSAAKNTLVELWPVVVIPDKPAIVQKIPAFQGFNPTKPHIEGTDVPPGFPFDATESIDPKDRELVEAGKASLEVLGRLSYKDDFAEYCHAFGVTYLGKPFNRLVFGTPHKDYCHGQTQTATFGAISVGTKPTQIWPPKSYAPAIEGPSRARQVP
jgi:hypothetical protein